MDLPALSCSIGTVRIGRVVGPAVAALERAEVGLVHVDVAVEVRREDALTVGDEPAARGRILRVLGDGREATQS